MTQRQLLGHIGVSHPLGQTIDVAVKAIGASVTGAKTAIKLSKRLAEAGEIVGIDVLDHVIIGDKKYLSMKREGLF